MHLEKIEHWTLTLCLFVPFWLGCYGYAIRFLWHALAPIARTRFSFYITDMWMSMLCLAPILSLIAKTAKVATLDRERVLTALAIITASQIFGIILGRLFSFPRDGEKLPRRLDQAICVVVGAYFFGLMGLATVAIAFTLLTIPALVLMSCPPSGVCVLVVAYLAFRGWSKAKRPR